MSIKQKFNFTIKPKSSMDKLISTLEGVVIFLTAVYLYLSGYQNNWIIALGIFGFLKLV